MFLDLCSGCIFDYCSWSNLQRHHDLIDKVDILLYHTIQRHYSLNFIFDSLNPIVSQVNSV